MTTPPLPGPDDDQDTEPATYSVRTRLREMLVTGEIPAGARLRAEALAARLEVSRTPIRSALAVLSVEGLVSYSVNKGYTVRAVSIGDILDSIETRAVLEALACRLSVEQGWEPDTLAEITGLVERGRAIVEDGVWSEALEREWYALNWRLHRQIHIASQNTALRNAVRMTLIYPLFGDVVRVCPCVASRAPLRARQLPNATPPHIVTSQAEHEAILDAIRRGEGEEAEQLMASHVRGTRDRIRATAALR